MFITLIILASVVAVLLILAVLIQNPKGGGIAANFSAANQIAGVKKTNEFVEKATWTLAIALFVFSIGSRFVYTQNVEQRNSFLDRIENSTPAAPAPISPVQQQPSSELDNQQLNPEATPEGQDGELPE
ncbi:MAG: preprotein translocase subunit SecG [Bacteroidia bacterium]|jgi:preprotein translocase subunit SecG